MINRIIRNSKKFAVCLIAFVISCIPTEYVKRHIAFAEDIRENIVETAKEYAGYKKGDLDCSGFTSQVYKKNGLAIPMNAVHQYKSGKRISLKSAKPGDLVFFVIQGNEISHVGLYLGDFNFIHSPGEGREIVYANINNPYWKNRYVGAVTYFGGSDKYQ